MIKYFALDKYLVEYLALKQDMVTYLSLDQEFVTYVALDQYMTTLRCPPLSNTAGHSTTLHGPLVAVHSNTTLEHDPVPAELRTRRGELRIFGGSFEKCFEMPVRTLKFNVGRSAVMSVSRGTVELH